MDSRSVWRNAAGVHHGNMHMKKRLIAVPSPRENVVLFSTYGYYHPGHRLWRVPLSGAVFEPHMVTLRRRLLLRLLRQMMRVPPEALESELFRERIGVFLAQRRPVRLHITSGELVFRLSRTRRDGLFSTTLRVTDAQLEKASRHGSWLNLQVVTSPEDPRAFHGRAHLLEPTGISVISDVDDTTKDTQVWCRRSLLVNTFLREYQSVDGMASLYSRWAEHGAAFHYVTASPWQLYESLWQLHQNAGFPEGTFHLRTTRLPHQMLRRLFLWPAFSKYLVLSRVMRCFPQRKFVLVGDSGERDPEIYGTVARRFPNQILAIYIRMVPGRKWSDRRARRAFRQVPSDMWRCFDSPRDLPDKLIDS